MPEPISYHRNGHPYDPEYKFCARCGKPLEKWFVPHHSPWDRKTGEQVPLLVNYVIGCPEYRHYEQLSTMDEHDHWNSNPTQLIN